MPHLRGLVIADGGVQIPPLTNNQIIGVDASGNVVAGSVGSIGRCDIIGHSLVAEGGATQLDFGSMHKYASLFPARFRNFAVGGAVASYPGTGGPIVTASFNGRGDRGWAWVASRYPNNERTTGMASTLTANTLVGAQNSVAVASSTGAIGYQTVIVGRGATSELATISTAPDGTHVSFVNALVNAHSSGEQIYAFADSHLANKQFVMCDFGWNDMAIVGATEYDVSFKHSLRTIWTLARQFMRFPDNHVTVRQTAGVWTHTASAGLALGDAYLSTTSTTATLTIDIPSTFQHDEVVDLHFLCGPDGSGALWTIQVDGANTTINGVANASTFDCRDQQAIDYGSTHTTPTNGQWNCLTARITGLAQGAHTIVLTPGTIKTTAYFNGWGVEPPIPPMMLIPQPTRFPNYATTWSTWPYGGVIGDASATTIRNTNNSLLTEFDTHFITAEMDSTWGGPFNKQAMYWWYDGVHYNDAGHALRIKQLALAIQGKVMPVDWLTSADQPDARGWYPVLPQGTTGYNQCAFLNSWVNVAGEPPSSFYKDIATGLVYIRCAVAGGTSPGAVMFQMPIGHRPSVLTQVAGWGMWGPAVFEIDSSGNVYNISNGSVSQHGFSAVYPAEQ